MQDAHAEVPAETEAGFYSGTAEEVPHAKSLLQHRHCRWAWLAQCLKVAAQGGT
ncbi:hypothetical protein [Hymenobacter crusticola]|uniref:hypothetical protein n=1 Tax=Hymenobacter crusticola TaxID=1770526 RepID=UPI0015C50F5F|nr:hypothetical protein [Hymenobacter crusticola]